jgi:hypothetical protein
MPLSKGFRESIEEAVSEARDWRERDDRARRIRALAAARMIGFDATMLPLTVWRDLIEQSMLRATAVIDALDALPVPERGK